MRLRRNHLKIRPCLFKRKRWLHCWINWRLSHVYVVGAPPSKPGFLGTLTDTSRGNGLFDTGPSLLLPLLHVLHVTSMPSPRLPSKSLAFSYAHSPRESWSAASANSKEHRQTKSRHLIGACPFCSAARHPHVQPVHVKSSALQTRTRPLASLRPSHTRGPR